jgi:primosomal protein N' (replication factor Y) (superfamily II helicase)
MVSEPILQIALSGPLHRLFDYLPPNADLTPPALGTRFQVPFGRGSRTGLLIGIGEVSALPRERLKRALRQLDTAPLLDERDLRLLRWAADYYHHPLGDVLFHALPVNLRKTRAVTLATAEGLRLSQAGREADLQTLSRAPKQLALMRVLSAHPDGLAKPDLMAGSGASDAVLRSLRSRGWIEPCPLSAPRPAHAQDAEKHRLNTAQQSAVDRVCGELGGFSPFLLHGVTGSGKTEVYLQLIETVLAQGKQALVLVPEIGLTPQLMARFRSRLGERVALLHSALADGERETVWHTVRQGEKQVLVGTRSAVFTPMPELALIIVDEEHDLSYKQQEGFRYCARDLALVRGQQRGCPVLLGSATPSLESLRNVAEGRYGLLELTQRVANASLPEMHLIDVRSVPLDGGLSPLMIREMRSALDAGEQVMLFLNRRGYAPMLTCHACGWLTDCPRCDARMTHHRKQHLLWCHHCGHLRQPRSARGGTGDGTHRRTPAPSVSGGTTGPHRPRLHQPQGLPGAVAGGYP